MTIMLASLIALGCLTLMYLLLNVGMFRQFRGRRLVTCPETGAPAAVEIDAAHVALSTTAGHPDVRLATCSRWPERAHCGQDCLQQIEAAPEDCLVRTIVARWYADKSCAFCGKSFGAVESWGHHQTALLSPSGETVEWGEVRPETLPALFTRMEPVCWSCHVAESFRRQHPELVTDRPGHNESL